MRQSAWVLTHVFYDLELRVKISVIGAGYVGLVTGACLAEIGHEVVCTDNDPAKLKILESGGVPIYEPGLDKLLAKARKKNLIRYCSNTAEAVAAGDAIFICVGTPPLPDGATDLSAIDHVARTIATEARSPKLVVEKSTVPARTGQELKRALSVYGRKSSVTFRVASNPEFLREGTAIEDFLHPDRIVVGVEDDTAEAQLREIYRPVLERKFNCPVHSPACPEAPAPAWLVTTINSAELIKHASNSFLALKISYANMVADLAERLGADIEEVMKAVGMDPRIGKHFLNAGLGFGGFCLPKDLQASHQVHGGGEADIVRIGLERQSEDAQLLVAEDSEALLIATEWEEFRKLDWERIRDAMAHPLILDGRNFLSPQKMRELGFEYHCFGRPD